MIHDEKEEKLEQSKLQCINFIVGSLVAKPSVFHYVSERITQETSRQERLELQHSTQHPK
jgi:hypothetical protein